MNTTVLVVVAVVAVLLLLLVSAAVAKRAGRRRRLRQRFGPEYDRAVGAAGNSRDAEADLSARAKERDQLTIKPLSRSQRDRYDQDWRQIQAEFVDYPARSLTRADALVGDVLTDRGYPMQDFDREADLISVDHPQIVEQYRRAHGIHQASQDGQASTEDLRQAFVSYRMLFADLLQDGEGNATSDTETEPASAESVAHSTDRTS
jgi:hypothetical protein